MNIHDKGKPTIRRSPRTKRQWECYIRAHFTGPDAWVFLACGFGRTPKAAYDSWADKLSSNIGELIWQREEKALADEMRAAWAVERKKASIELFGRDVPDRLFGRDDLH